MLCLLLGACASGKAHMSGDASVDTNSPFDVIMPELSQGDAVGKVGDGSPGDTTLDGVGPGKDASPDKSPTPDLSPPVDMTPPPDVTLPPDKTPPPDSQPTGSIQVTTPKGGELWTAGSKRFITWNASASVKWLNLDLYKGGVKVLAMALSIANTGKWTWTIPSSQTHGSDYRVVLTDAQNSSIKAQSAGTFTISNWRYRAAVTVDSGKATQALGNYPVLLELTSSNFSYAHARTDGGDLRFSSSPSLGSFDINHWVETWSYNGTSKIWVLIPSLAAKSVRTVYLYYGNTAAMTTSSKTKALPTQLNSTGSLSLGGSHTYDSFQLNAGHTLTVTQGQPLTITARLMVINGVINGNGLGYSGGSSNSKGLGTGGGGGTSDSGGGGAGYGGLGGQGGHDSSDSPGKPGSMYGGSSLQSVQMGSGGGGGGGSSGGAGGGAVTLIARSLFTVGDIKVDGSAGGGSAQSGGGGSGGGILIKGYEVTLKSLFSARGGDGGSGSSTANDGGGGGGGGRIKVLYEKSLSQSGLWLVTGGVGGKYGDASHGQAGKSGTTYKGKAQVEVVGVQIGAEKTL